MKKLLFISLLFLSINTNAQSLSLCIDSFVTAITYGFPTPTAGQIALATTRATKYCNAIAAYVGSAGYGTVTSITPGIGFTSHVPINTAGTMNVDTVSTIATIWFVNNSIAGLFPTADTIYLHNQIITKQNLSDTLTYDATKANLNNASALLTTNLNDTAGVLRTTINTKLNINDTSYLHNEIVNKYNISDTTYLLRRIDSNLYKSYITPTYFNNNIPSITGKYNTTDTTYLFRKVDSNTYKGAVTLNYVNNHYVYTNTSPITLTAGSFGFDYTQAGTFTAVQNIIQTGLGTTSTNSLLIGNTTPATALNPAQYAGDIRFGMTAWNTAAVASQPVSVNLHPRAISSSAISAGFDIQASTNGSAFANVWSFSGGSTTITGNCTVGSTLYSTLGIVSTGRISPNLTATTVNCSTSGSVQFKQCFNGSGYSEVLAWSNACLGTASYTYATAMTNTPMNETGSALITSISNTAMTITGTGTTTFVGIKGW